MFPQIQHKNRVVTVDQTRVYDNALARTYLSAAVSVGTTLTVKDIAGFAVGKYVWINPFGANAEIVAVHAATVPTGNTITLAATTVYQHAAGEEVVYVEFNRIEISHADTIDGVKTVKATVSMVARDRELRSLDTTETSGYYFARFNESVGGTFGTYSDPVPYGGWEPYTVGGMIDVAFRDTSNTFGAKVTLEDCLHWINQGLREVKGKLRTWPEHAVSNYVIGQTVRGVNTITLPTDIYDSETNRSIKALRFGNKGELRYLEPDLFQAQQPGIALTQVRTQATAGDTSLLIENSYDLPATGSVSVYVAGVKHVVTYTGVTRSTTVGVLTGIPASGDGSITVTLPIGTNVWFNELEGDPAYYTVRNGVLEYWPLCSEARQNENVYLDYDARIESVATESDRIDMFRYDMIEAYLTWRIWCKVDNGGMLDRSNGYYLDYKERMNDAIRTLPNRRVVMSPNLNTMSKRGRFMSRPDVRKLSNDQL